MRWLLAVALVLPAAVPYVAHYALGPAGEEPSGFILFDMAYYMANAREYFDNGFHLTYGNPFHPDPGTPRIYSQPHVLVLGFLARTTGLEPGTVLVLFGLVAAAVCARVAMALYERLVGFGGWPQALGLLLFFWGGGFLTLAGLVPYLTRDEADIRLLFAYDPFQGWWFLNFGRNLILPTEAYYHALALGAIVMLLDRRYRWATALLLVLSASHPFTGVEILLIVVVWCAIELFFLGERTVPRGFFAAAACLLLAHLAYYLVFLGSFSDHRLLLDQWRLPWVYGLASMVPAYGLVGAFAVWAHRSLERTRKSLSQPPRRLLLTWFLVAFFLANHEFAFDPIQPLHFTRGYVWTPLFFLGAPALIALLSRLGDTRRRRSGLGAGAIVILVALFLADNAVWLSSWILREKRPDGATLGLYLHPAFREVLDWLDEDENRDYLLVSDDPYLGYLATVYTPIRSWHSHPHNTPEVDEKERDLRLFFTRGELHPAWRERPVLFVFTGPEADAVRAQESRFFGTLPVERAYDTPFCVIYRWPGGLLD